MLRIGSPLVRSPREEVVYVKSYQIRSSVCEAFAPNGYFSVSRPL
jgi:hypothetical protein